MNLCKVVADLSIVSRHCISKFTAASRGFPAIARFLVTHRKIFETEYAGFSHFILYQVMHRTDKPTLVKPIRSYIQ